RYVLAVPTMVRGYVPSRSGHDATAVPSARANCVASYHARRGPNFRGSLAPPPSATVRRGTAWRRTGSTRNGAISSTSSRATGTVLRAGEHVRHGAVQHITHQMLAEWPERGLDLRGQMDDRR